MPDPRLVSRAQRAATMLERAWERWRATQGLEAEPMPPVSSYVGYSIEEPWGRPRVVFGVNAEDAERLAALLQENVGHGPEDLPRPGDPDYRPPVRGGFAPDRPAMPDRGYDQSLLDDVRGRIPVQGWPPEFSDSREQLNSAGPSRLDEPELPLGLGPVPDEEPGRAHDLKPPVELGLSDEFRPADDFPDADAFPAADSPAGDSQRDAPYGVPYAGEAPYGIPYTGEPYYPDEVYGQTGPGGYGAAGAGGYGAAGAMPAPGGYGAAGPYPPADDLPGEREEPARRAPDGAGGPGERPEPELTAATAEVPTEAPASEDASREVSRPDASGRDGSSRDEDVRDESGWKEDTRDEPEPDEDGAGEPGGDEDLRTADARAVDPRALDPRAVEPRAEDTRGGDTRGGDVRHSAETPDPDGAAGKHLHPGGVPAPEDDGAGDPLSRDAQPDQAPRPHDGPVPGPRHGSGPDGPDWPPVASARPAPARPGQEPPAAAQSAAGVPGGPTASGDQPADAASRGSITDTMAAELAGWAAGELPGQAAARLASWAAAGGAVARGRQQTGIGGGGTAAERVS
jgi:hypothetical protein